MTTLELLQSVQHIVINGERLAVIKANDWERLIEWLETIEDIQVLKQSLAELKSSQSERKQASWLQLHDVNVTAFSARQIVTGFVADHISTNMHGANPTLLVGDHTYWRVPIILSMIPMGDMGEVGAIDVDVETGQMQINSALIKEITERAENLATRSPSRAAAA